MTAETTVEPVKPRVLVVEDEAVVAMDVRHRLGRLGYDVCGLADTGEQAVDLVGQLAPDLVLMDIMLAGDMDGVDAAARIRDGFGAPVVFLTAHSDTQTLKRAGSVSPYGYIVKPFEDRELNTALEIALYKSRTERQLVENERWMSITLENLGEGVITADPEGRVRFCNPVAANLLGLSAGDMLGRDLDGVYRARQEPGAGEDMDEGGGREHARLCRTDGRIIPVEQTRSPILDGQGRRLGMVLVFRDVSRRQQVEKALQESVDRLRRTLEETVNALTVTSEKRDPFTAGHQERVSRLAFALAGELGFSAEEREGVRVAGLVHDIGKIHVPSEILAKPDVLSEMEMGIVRDHSLVGYEILRDIPFPWPVARMVLEHHERQDGSGYPSGLSRDAVLFGSRILAVADVVEAMNSHRPYRASHGLERSLAELADGRGTRYDPDVVDACLLLFRTSSFHF
uniref:Putative domain HDIG-containing protein n=1 Tax=Desulfovibrio sp. U5L TaxID=596152 RepID=I2Q1P1_9BACT